jgi:hypothetical protein
METDDASEKTDLPKNKLTDEEAWEQNWKVTDPQSKLYKIRQRNASYKRAEAYWNWRNTLRTKYPNIEAMEKEYQIRIPPPPRVYMTAEEWEYTIDEIFAGSKYIRVVKPRKNAYPSEKPKTTVYEVRFFPHPPEKPEEGSDPGDGEK